MLAILHPIGCKKFELFKSTLADGHRFKYEKLPYLHNVLTIYNQI